MKAKLQICVCAFTVILLATGAVFTGAATGQEASNMGFLSAPSNFPPVVRTANGGVNDELDDLLLEEDFNGGELPPGWTVQDGGEDIDDTWMLDNFGLFGGFDGTDLMWVSSAGNFDVLLDERLISPSFDCSGYVSIILSFDQWYFDLTENDYATVDISTSGIEGPWINIETYTAEIEGYPTSLDISGQAAGQGDVRIRFRYYDGSDEALYWFIDNFSVEGFGIPDAFPPVVNLVSWPTVNFSGQTTTIVATATDESGITGFDLSYGHYVGDEVVDLVIVAMIPTVNPDEYSADIPGGFQSAGDQIAWSLLAVDGSDNSNEKRLPTNPDEWYLYNVYDQLEDVTWGEHHFFWQEINETGTDLELENTEIVEVVFTDYGFADFTWYGETYDRIWVCSNGWITFNEEAIAFDQLPDFPRTSDPNNVISLLASNLDPSVHGAVYVGVDNDNFVIEWDSLYFYNRDFGPTGQIVLDQDMNRVYLNYEIVDTEWNRPYTIGYENTNGDLGYTIMSGTDWTGMSSGTAYRIGPSGGSLEGYVDDTNGNPLENVSIDVFVADTEIQQASTPTGADGNYDITDLLGNIYDVTANCPGFISVTQEDIVVVDGQVSVLDFTLTPALELTLTAFNPPVLVPAGDSFRFGVTVVNNTPDEISFDAWSEALHPDGEMRGPLLEVFDQNVPGNFMLSVAPYQYVSQYAEPGMYVYYLRVMAHPDETVNSDSMIVEVLPAQGPILHDMGWAAFGWGEEKEENVLVSVLVPNGFRIENVYPNPFNPTTAVAISLPRSATLEVSVYNTLGQEVAVLAQGRYAEGYHNFTFDANRMASGIYFIQATVPGEMNELRKVVLMR